MKLRSFTLIEMILVIVIVSIMLLISLSISSNQTKILRFKIAREAFIANYNTWLIRAITTNSNETTLQFTANNSSGQPLVATGSSADLLHFEDASQVQITQINGVGGGGVLPISYILTYNPQGGCTLTPDNTTYLTNLIVPITVKYRDNASIDAICYSLDLSSCKLKQTGCPQP